MNTCKIGNNLRSGYRFHDSEYERIMDGFRKNIKSDIWRAVAGAQASTYARRVLKPLGLNIGRIDTYFKESVNKHKTYRRISTIPYLVKTKESVTSGFQEGFPLYNIPEGVIIGDGVYFEPSQFDDYLKGKDVGKPISPISEIIGWLSGEKITDIFTDLHRVIRNRMSDTKYFEESINAMLEKWGYRVVEVSKESFEVLKRNHNIYYDTNAVIIDKTIYVSGGISADIKLHEFLHPFVTGLYFTDRFLFEELYEEAMKTGVYDNKFRMLAVREGDYEEAKMEVVTSFLGDVLSGKYAKADSSLSDKIIRAIKMILYRIFGVYDPYLFASYDAIDLSKDTIGRVLEILKNDKDLENYLSYGTIGYAHTNITENDDLIESLKNTMFSFTTNVDDKDMKKVVEYVGMLKEGYMSEGVGSFTNAIDMLINTSYGPETGSKADILRGILRDIALSQVPMDKMNMIRMRSVVAAAYRNTSNLSAIRFKNAGVRRILRDFVDSMEMSDVERLELYKYFKITNEDIENEGYVRHTDMNLNTILITYYLLNLKLKDIRYKTSVFDEIISFSGTNSLINLMEIDFGKNITNLYSFSEHFIKRSSYSDRISDFMLALGNSDFITFLNMLSSHRDYREHEASSYLSGKHVNLVNKAPTHEEGLSYVMSFSVLFLPYINLILGNEGSNNTITTIRESLKSVMKEISGKDVSEDTLSGWFKDIYYKENNRKNKEAIFRYRRQLIKSMLSDSLFCSVLSGRSDETSSIVDIFSYISPKDGESGVSTFLNINDFIRSMEALFSLRNFLSSIREDIGRKDKNLTVSSYVEQTISDMLALFNNYVMGSFVDSLFSSFLKSFERRAIEQKRKLYITDIREVYEAVVREKSMLVIMNIATYISERMSSSDRVNGIEKIFLYEFLRSYISSVDKVLRSKNVNGNNFNDVKTHQYEIMSTFIADHNIYLLHLLKRYMYAMVAYRHLLERSREILAGIGVDVSEISNVRDLIRYINELKSSDEYYMWIIAEGADEGLAERVRFDEFLNRLVNLMGSYNIRYSIGTSKSQFVDDVGRKIKFLEGDDNAIGYGGSTYMRFSGLYGLGIMFGRNPHLIKASEETGYEGYADFLHLMTAESVLGSYISYINNVKGPAKYITVNDLHALPIMSLHYIYMLMAMGEGQETAASGFANMLAMLNSIYGIAFGTRNLSADVRVRVIEHLRGKIRVEGVNNISTILNTITSIPNITDGELRKRGWMGRKLRIKYEQEGAVSENKKAAMAILNLYLVKYSNPDEDFSQPSYIQKMRGKSKALNNLLKDVDGDFGEAMEKNKIFIYENASPLSSTVYNDFKAIRSFFMEFISTNISHTFNVRSLEDVKDKKLFAERLNKIASAILGYYAAEHMMGVSRESEAILTMLAYMIGIPEDDMNLFLFDPVYYLFCKKRIFGLSIVKDNDGNYVYDIKFNVSFYKYDEDEKEIILARKASDNNAFTNFILRHVRDRYHIVSQSGSGTLNLFRDIDIDEFSNHLIPLIINNIFGSDNTSDTFISTFLQHMESYMPVAGFRYSNQEGSKFNLFTGLYEDIFYSIIGRRYVAVNDFTHLLSESRRLLVEAFKTIRKEQASETELYRIVSHFDEAYSKLKRYESASKSIPDYGFLYGYRHVNRKLAKAFNFIIGKILDGERDFIQAFVTGYVETPSEVGSINIASFIKTYTGKKYRTEEGSEGRNMFLYYLDVLSSIIKRHKIEDVVISILRSGEYQSLTYDVTSGKLSLKVEDDGIYDYLWGSYELSRFYTILIDSVGGEVRNILSDSFYGDLILLTENGVTYHAKKPSLYNILEFMHSLPGILINGHMSKTLKDLTTSKSHSVFIDFYNRLLKDADLHYSQSTSGTFSESIISGGSESFSKYKNLASDIQELSAAYFAFVKSVARFTETVVPRVKIKPSAAVQAASMKIKNILTSYPNQTPLGKPLIDEISRILTAIYHNYIEENIYVTSQYYGESELTEGTYISAFYGNKDLLGIIGRSASYDHMFVDFGPMHISRDLKAVPDILASIYGSLMPFSLSRELRAPHIYGSNNMHGVRHYNAVKPSVSSYANILSDIHYKHVINLFEKMRDPSYLHTLRSNVHKDILKRYYDRYLNHFHVKFISSINMSVEGLFSGNKNIGFGDVSEFRHVLTTLLLSHMSASHKIGDFENTLLLFSSDAFNHSKVNMMTGSMNDAILQMLIKKGLADPNTSGFWFRGMDDKDLSIRHINELLRQYVDVMSEIRYIQSEILKIKSILSRLRVRENIFMSADIRNKGIGIHKGMKVYLPGEDLNPELLKESVMSLVSSLHNLFLKLYGGVQDYELFVSDGKGNHYIDLRKIHGKVNPFFSGDDFLYADMVGILVSLGIIDSAGLYDERSVTALFGIGDRMLSEFDNRERNKVELYRDLSEYLDKVMKLISDRFLSQDILQNTFLVYNKTLKYDTSKPEKLFQDVGVTPKQDIKNASETLASEYLSLIKTISSEITISMDANPSVSERYNHMREHIAYNLISSLFNELHNRYVDFVSSLEHSMFVSEISKKGIDGILSMYAAMDPYLIFKDTEKMGFAVRPEPYYEDQNMTEDEFSSLLRVTWYAHQNSLPVEIRLGSQFPLINYETHALEPVISSFASLSEDETLKHYVFGRLGNLKIPGKSDNGIASETISDAVIALSHYNVRASNYANRVIFSYMMGNIADYLEIVQKGGIRDISSQAPYYDFIIRRFVDDMSVLTPVSSIPVNKIRSAINNVRTSIVLKYIRAMMEGIPSGSALSAINKAVTVVLFMLSLYIFSFLSFDSILVVMSTLVFFFFLNLFGRSLASAGNFWEHTFNYLASMTPALKHTSIIATSAILKPFNFIASVRRMHEKIFDRGMWISQFLPVQEVYHFENKITHDFAHVDRSLSRFTDLVNLLRASFKNKGLKALADRNTYSYLLSSFTNIILYIFNVTSHYTMLPKSISESYINMFSLNYASRAVPLLKNQKVRIGDKDIVIDIYYHLLHFTRNGLLKDLKVKYKGKTHVVSLSDDPSNPNRELAARIRSMIDDPQFNSTLSTYASFSSSYIPIRNVLIASIKSWAAPFLRILYYLKSAVFPVNYMLRHGSYNNVYMVKYMGLRNMGFLVSTLFVLSSLFTLLFPFQQSWFVIYTILIAMAPIFYSAIDGYYNGFIFGGMGRGSVLSFAKDYLKNRARIPILYSLTFTATMLLSAMFRKTLCQELGYRESSEMVITGTPYGMETEYGFQTFMGPEVLSYFCSSLVSADQHTRTFRSFYDSTRQSEGRDIASVSEKIKDMIEDREDTEVVKEHLIDLYHSALYNSCVFMADVMRASIRKYMDEVLKWRETKDPVLLSELESFYKNPVKIIEYEGRSYEEGSLMDYYPTFGVELAEFPEREDVAEIRDFRSFLDYIEGLIGSFNKSNSAFVENKMIPSLYGGRIPDYGTITGLHKAIEDETERLSEAVNTYRRYAENTTYFIEFMRTPQFIPSVNKNNALRMAYAIRSYIEEYGSAITEKSHFGYFRDRVTETLEEIEDREFAEEIKNILWGKAVNGNKLREAREEYEKMLEDNDIEKSLDLKSQIAMYGFAWFIKNYRFYEQHKAIYSLREWTTFAISDEEVARSIINTIASYRNMIETGSGDLMVSFYDFPFLSGYGVVSDKTYRYRNLENLYKSIQNAIRLIPGIESFVINSRNYNSTLPHILKSNIETFPLSKTYTMKEMWEMMLKNYGIPRQGEKENVYDSEHDIISMLFSRNLKKRGFIEKSVGSEPVTNMKIEVKKEKENKAEKK